MTYAETLDYLYAKLPMFTRIGAAAFKKDLTNTIELCRRLGDPHKKFRTIHVGGTNGKGSTSHMLAAILQTAGYKTGLYTSPHLLDFRERIRINGEMISQEDVVAFVHAQKASIEEIAPSFFEATVAMAFDHFAQQETDIAIIEVGLGGRLDSTNIITPLLSVITNISYDHMNMLGNTLGEIAGEKAGIIKPGIPVVIGEKQEETAQVFLSKASGTGSTLVFGSDLWETAIRGRGKYLDIDIKYRLNGKPSSAYDFPSPLQLDLTGSYQEKNLTTVLSAVAELRRQGFHITGEHLRAALKEVSTLTGLAGRWQTLSHSPLIICDTGHNKDGIREVVKNLEATPYQHLHLVIGMVKDKDISAMLSLLPKEGRYYFCQPAIERGKPAEELAGEAGAFGLTGDIYPTVREALEAARKNASAADLVFIGGSTFVVAEVI
ncbi:bifunctional folylpolyglutamate synthase/dihydrofolate synthase [Hufsiella ginkgonis]|uniref:Dihydrofolate synthase/folylpolyglutamate synthase n=1 Tax=Hufsiella ginkgonis TaxID=2695274 RepID=A0A7K1XZ50_9SPHI|nr:folylpolyglutamate synthase/dihydrofolate synthase family protein [Hufsiella ginkgonis]MXV16285.1 bifunctional folylpolyglutamate synthase/dihydrofolate synthase [Hufsiella ginkgonis]